MLSLQFQKSKRLKLYLIVA
uniref:Uncharacterized protein n=1 Tax=Rhizophora mucronata TaxID=61149 RepID=A0A2P2P6M9_RHIMU